MQGSKFDLSQASLHPDVMKARFLSATAQLSAKQALESQKRQDRLKRFSDSFEQSVKEAIKAQGYDPDKVAAELQQAIAIVQQGKGRKLLAELDKKYGQVFQQVRQQVGAGNAVREIEQALTLDTKSILKPLPGGGASVTEEPLTVVQTSTGFLSQQRFRPPYNAWIVTGPREGGNSVTPGTGQHSASVRTLFVGSEQQRTALGQRFVVPAGVKRIELQAKMPLAHIKLVAGAAFGYATAEAYTFMMLMDSRGFATWDARNHVRLAATIIGWAEQEWIAPQEFAATYTRPDPTREETVTIYVGGKISGGVGALGGGAGGYYSGMLKEITVRFF